MSDPQGARDDGSAGLDPEVAAMLAGQSEPHPDTGPSPEAATDQQEAVRPPRARSAASAAALALIGVLVGAAVLDPTGLLAPIPWIRADLIVAPWAWLQYLLLAPLAVYLTWSWVRRILVGASPAAPRRWVASRSWLVVVLALMTATLVHSVVLMTPALIGFGDDGLRPVASAGYLVWSTGLVGLKAVAIGWVPALAAAVLWAPGQARRAGVPARAEAPTLALLSAALVTVALVVIGGWTATQWWTGSPAGYAHPTDWRLLAPIAHGQLAEVVALLIVWLLLAWSIRATLKHIDAPRSRSARLLAGAIGGIAASLGLAVVQSVVALLTGTDVAGDDDLWILPSTVLRLMEALSFGLLMAPIGALSVWLVSRASRRHWSWLGVVAATAVAVGAIVLVVRGAQAPPGPDTLAGSQPAAADLPEQQAGAQRTTPQRLTVRRDADSSAVLSDQSGAQVILHGVSVNQLGDYYQADPKLPAVADLTEQDFIDIAAMGFNAVRLVLHWSALEPAPGQIDAAYIDRAKQAVGWAADHGMHVVLSLHQDAWGKSVVAADGERCRPRTQPMTGWGGAPDWATHLDGAPACYAWRPGMAANAQRAFTSFYVDREGIESHLVEVWRRLGEEFGGIPAVAGYDLINEASTGEQPPLTSGMLLGRFHARAIRAIRDGEAKAPEGYAHPVFLQPSLLWTAFGLDALPPDGFTADPQVVFAPHAAATPAILGRPLVGIERGVSLARRAADGWGVPLWVGEWGLAADKETSRERNQRFVTAVESLRVGSAVWLWKQACGNPAVAGANPTLAVRPVSCPKGKDRKVRTAELEPLLRPYPRSAPGRITAIRTDGRRVQVDGDSTGAGQVDGTPDSCRLDIWVPGAAEPTVVDTIGVTDIRFERVPEGSAVQAPSGGWRALGCAAGAYRLTVS